MMEQKLSGNKIKLIALDMDGTLLDSNKDLSERNLEALNLAIKKGIKIIPSTGRPAAGLPQKLLSNPHIRYSICSNGAAIIDLKNKAVIHRKSLSRGMTLFLIDLLGDFDVHVDIFADGGITTEEGNMRRLGEFIIPPNMLPYIAETRTTVKDLKSYVKDEAEHIEKVNLFFKSIAHRTKVTELLGGVAGIAITSSLQVNLEINNIEANKGYGLRWLSEYLDISSKETMAIGDSSNDESMLRTAGIAVAMKNSTDDIIALADYITDSNDEDGVEKAIKKFINEKES